MMNVHFKDTTDDENYTPAKLCVQIDNQKIKNLEIREVIRYPTNILTTGQLDTTLYNPIDIDMLLVVPDSTADEESSYTDVVEKGFVNISITNVYKSITYEEKKISFRNGIIQTQMTSQLNVGDYLLTIEYAGNRYYEPTQLAIQFSVKKRMVECRFHEDIDGGYPDEVIEVPISLFDVLNGKTINHCTVNYSFNEESYTTYTDNRGYAKLSFKMPSVNGEYCANNIITNDQDIVNEYVTDPDIDVYWTLDGTLVPYDDIQQFVDGADSADDDIIEDEPTLEITDIESIVEDDEIVEKEIAKYNVYIYTLTIAIDNDVYDMEEQTIYLSAKKMDTRVMSYFTKNDNESILIVEGDVLNHTNYMTSNVQYGTVEVCISDVSYRQQVSIDEYGHFICEIPYGGINKGPSNNIEPYVIFCSPDHPTSIKLINMDKNDGEELVFTPDYIHKKNINFLATVTDNITYSNVNESMVTFVIKNDGKEVYRYVTEVDETGEAFFAFDISKDGDYTIQAFYHPMFNFLGSESQIINYKVNDAIEE